VDLAVDGANPDRLGPGGYALIPPASSFRLVSVADGDMLMLRKAYEPLAGVAPPDLLVGDVAAVPASPYLGDDGVLLQTLVPDEMTYDLAMNIFTFAPGRSLPVVETHVMEHGLWFLQGKGLYYLDDSWMEVEQNDFIWMGPYVPPSFCATGPVPAKYLYYKNVNREIAI
jgi:(S)-ureidoglycine aminohydrolase